MRAPLAEPPRATTEVDHQEHQEQIIITRLMVALALTLTLTYRLALPGQENLPLVIVAGGGVVVVCVVSVCS